MSLGKEVQESAFPLKKVAFDMNQIMENLDTRDLDLEEVDFEPYDPSLPVNTRIPFSAIYKTKGFKETDIQVYLNEVHITAKVLEVERGIIAQHERVSSTQQRLTSQVKHAGVFTIELKHGGFTWRVKRKEKHFHELHRELITYKTLMRIPMPTRRALNNRRTASMHVVQQGEAVSKMTEENYLSLKNYPELYDKGHHNYKDTDLKGNIWESISKELDKPVNTRIPFSAIYKTKGFKETDIQVYLNEVHITAKVLEVERGIIAQHERVSSTQQRLTSQVKHAGVFTIELKHGGFTWRVKRKEKHFHELHRELITYKTLMRIPMPTRRWLVVKDSFIMYMKPDSGAISFVMLVDKEFCIKMGLKDTETKHGVRIDSLSRLSPEIFLKRPVVEGNRWRLDYILKRKAVNLIFNSNLFAAVSVEQLSNAPCRYINATLLVNTENTSVIAKAVIATQRRAIVS
ncbi:UNVERIFIED_CONTAM: hypothetical protein FKN15_026963 [Acipenser sinensis]